MDHAGHHRKPKSAVALVSLNLPHLSINLPHLSINLLANVIARQSLNGTNRFTKTQQLWLYTYLSVIAWLNGWRFSA